MDSKYILIVEDERPIREMMSFWLRRAGCEAVEAADAKSARLSIAQRRPDFLLIDWVLPRISGLDLAMELRGSGQTASIPIIMVTARAEEQDRVMALDGGVDDYLVKPFSPRELLARIDAVLRRAKGRPSIRSEHAKGLVLDAKRQCLNAGEVTVQLSPMDFRLLKFFITNPERVHNRAQLLEQVWGGSAHAEERTVDVQIRRLRKALEQSDFDRYIQTVRGTGYRFSTRMS